jgi:pimeloyl-ACP methyl ester carboxylesterase
MNYSEIVKAAKKVIPLLNQLLGASALEVAAELRRLLERAEKGEADADKRILQLLAKHRATREWLARYSAPKPAATTRRSAEPAATAGQTPELFARIKIFYATDRKATGDRTPACLYSGECADSEELAFGTCEVSIPATHLKGKLEMPSLLRLEFRADPRKHVVLLAVSPLARVTFFQDVTGMVNQASLKDAFVFVHGYNVSFEDAARRTAQLAHDLPFSGAPILYSWPSRATALSYKRDENSIEWSTPHLRLFLLDVAARTGAQVVHLIAHSMGNRAVTRPGVDRPANSTRRALSSGSAHRAGHRRPGLPTTRSLHRARRGTHHFVRFVAGQGIAGLEAFQWRGPRRRCRTRTSRDAWVANHRCHRGRHESIWSFLFRREPDSADGPLPSVARSSDS